MFSKEQFIQSLQLETNICKYLFSKMPTDKMDYRPTENQRSMLELLQYLTSCVKTSSNCLIDNDWTSAATDMEKIKSLTADEFCDAMDRQLEEVKARIESIPEQEFFSRETTFPTGDKSVLGAALVNFPLKFITAYRMQLFLYLKAVGRSELNTVSCWFGIDKPMN